MAASKANGVFGATASKLHEPSNGHMREIAEIYVDGMGAQNAVHDIVNDAMLIDALIDYKAKQLYGGT